ncbi:MAG: undecaprenyl-diphosphate phosphatase [Deltaproteobacteria bacterium]|nr:undecaprenyl-diphosphate phosphatase [Deltaproteobacteria bacterium]
MNPLQAIALGVLQGLTEFLPVSSSGHLVLLQHLFGIKEPELLFDISLHLGTLIAVCVIFFKEIRSLLLTLLHLPAVVQSSDRLVSVYKDNEDVRMIAFIGLGSIPTAIIGILLHKKADQLFVNIWMVGVMLVITGIFLWTTRFALPEGRTPRRMNAGHALTIGLVQGMAILPGVSRSGSTISVALLLGIKRENSAKYSFLLSIPAIVGALIMELNSDRMHSSVSIEALLSGTAAAAIVGFMALKILLRVIKGGHLYFFSPYCWLIGCVAIVSAAIQG